MRLALLLAAPFPLHQGSQVYVADQARALAVAGAEPVLVCYGAGDGGAEPCPVVRAPAAVSPQTLGSSIHPRKLVADAALARALLRAHRARPFDAVLAHNSEAAAVALALRGRLGIPVVYVVHTLLEYELSAYVPRVLAPLLGPLLDAWLDRLGGVAERSLARHADAVLCLGEDARRALEPVARGPVSVIPPGLDPAAPPSPSECETVCSKHGVEPGGFVLYAGNVDAYQDLELLDAAAARVPEAPTLVATHDARGARFEALRIATVSSAEEVRALLHTAAVAVLPRRRRGGFPIKLLNYMEASRAIVAHEDVGCGLVHGESGWLLPEGADAHDWAAAIRTLLSEPARRAALGAGARAQLTAAHAWPNVARRTLALVDRASAAG